LDLRLKHVKSEATKRYLTEQWQHMFHRQEQRQARAVEFQQRLRASSLTGKARKRERKLFSRAETTLTRELRVKLSTRDFEKIKKIGRGASGVILLTTRGQIKLADFGLSTHFEKRDIAFLHILEELREILIGQTQTAAFENGARPIGTVDYIAPEVLCQQDYDVRCDWWSLGSSISPGQTGRASPVSPPPISRQVHRKFPSMLIGICGRVPSPSAATASSQKITAPYQPNLPGPLQGTGPSS
jgi:hypothetical protein